MRFFKKKKRKEYDHEKQVPVIRKSICTGEETAGFQNKETGHFEGVLFCIFVFLFFHGISPFL